MNKQYASLSLDLDNKWSYLKTHGDPGWESFPSYLDVVVPRVLDICQRRGITMTFFIVGQDAAIDSNHEVLRSIADAGHEIGNHSFHHEPWLHLYSKSQIEAELTSAADALETATGQRPIGFRGPGFSLSPTVLEVLAEQRYQYDCSTFPSYLGPLARAYYFMTADLTDKEKKERKLLFGGISEGFRSLKPYRWPAPANDLVEIPVTTMPIFKVPIHLSYLLYLASYSQTIAFAYYRLAIGLCRLTGVQPSLLLHPLDFLGCDDDPDLSFFPAMDMTSTAKVGFAERILDRFGKTYEIVTMTEHATRAGGCERHKCAASHSSTCPSTVDTVDV